MNELRKWCPVSSRHYLVANCVMLKGPRKADEHT